MIPFEMHLNPSTVNTVCCFTCKYGTGLEQKPVGELVHRVNVKPLAAAVLSHDELKVGTLLTERRL